MKRLLWLGLLALTTGTLAVRAEEAPKEEPKKEEAKTEAPKEEAKTEAPKPEEKKEEAKADAPKEEVKKEEPKEAPKEEAKEEKKEDEALLAKISYIIGLNIGGQFKQDDIHANLDSLVKGLKDAMDGKQPAMSQQEIQQTMDSFKKMMIAKQQEKMKAQMEAAAKEGEKNAAQGKAFLDENKKKEGVQTTATGLQYKVLKDGEGDKPKASDRVTVHYKGTLLDGTEFDSSYRRKEPASFKLDEVIKGWTEGVQLMKVGSKYQFWIPSELAYGANVRPDGPIPANATLVFEVELLAVGDAAPKGE
ncbi:MAG: FKBP-type peptidyl-prolyl cis-trans isomerase [Planctomycetota bacterium]|nr:FKBP-type peptidyl-prolyl cis-trans isomerase [Planctomycetota bacterium]